VNEIYDLKSYQEWQYDPEDMKKIESALDAYPNVYPLLRQAAECPDLDFKLDYNLPPTKLLAAILDQNNSSSLRTPARYLLARAKLLIFQKNGNEALQSAIIMLQLSRKAEHEPLIINYLVAKVVEDMALDCANEILQSGPVTDNMKSALETELSLHDAIRPYQQVLKSERAYGLDCFRHEIPHLWIMYRIWQLSVLDVFDEYLNCSLQQYSVCAGINKQHATSKSSLKVFAALLRPAIHQALLSAYRSQALARALRIINALQRKAPHDGDKIPTMAELGLPGEVGIDPYNGKVMIIKKLPEGWLVYSVGENLKDDGGKVEEESDNRPLDVGFGPKTAKQQLQEKEPTR
jgi:hypothetical protein